MPVLNWMLDTLFLLLQVYISLHPWVLTLIVTGVGEMQLLLLLLFYHSAEVQHLKIVNESYGKHLLFTVKLSYTLLLLAGCAILHGLLPFILTGTVSDKIKHLNTVLSER